MIDLSPEAYLINSTNEGKNHHRMVLILEDIQAINLVQKGLEETPYRFGYWLRVNKRARNSKPS